MNKIPKLCLVSSSGGHWEQLQKFRSLANKYDGFFVTERTPFEVNAKYLLKQTDLKDKMMIFRMLYNVIKTLYIWIIERPDYVITTGSMVAYPFYLLARLTRKKFIMIDTFGRANMPTITGKMVDKHADLHIVQWESQKKNYKNAIYGGSLY
jgi:UDP-N-acetylglucosamine:LPS N-acetylglucosamine transferase